MRQCVRVEIEINGDSETQSMATNVSGFMNYNITPRAAFYGRSVNDSRNRRTILVPEANQTSDERFRNFVNSNYCRSRAVTTKTETDAGDTRTIHVIYVIMNSNGFNTYRMQPGTSVAKVQNGQRSNVDRRHSSARLRVDELEEHTKSYILHMRCMDTVSRVRSCILHYVHDDEQCCTQGVRNVYCRSAADMFVLKILLWAVLSCALNCMT